MLSKLLPISVLASVVLSMGHAHAGLQLRHMESKSAPAPSMGAYGGGYGGDMKKHHHGDKSDSESKPAASWSVHGGKHYGDKKKHGGSHEIDSTTTTTSTHTETATVYTQKPSAVKDVEEKKPEKPTAAKDIEENKPARAMACRARYSAAAPEVASPGKEASQDGSSPKGDTPEEGPKAPSKPSSEYGMPEASAKPTPEKARPSHREQKPSAAAPSAYALPSPVYASVPVEQPAAPSAPLDQYGPAPSGSDYAAPPANSDLALVKPSGSWLQSPDAAIQTAAPAPPSDVPAVSAPPPAPPASDSVVYVIQTVEVVPVPVSSGAPARRVVRRF